MKKYIVVLVFNIVLGTIALLSYSEAKRKTLIFKTENPIHVRVVDVTYAKYGDRSTVDFNGKIYKNIAVPLNVGINKIDTQNYYYDKLNDRVISKDVDKTRLWVIIGLFFISLLLWLIPKKVF
ncbi:MAG: hypothetical protein IE909_13665 [Campylobacterales bacterium]|nr:hypothetical protein [Campylobacterales bacterium]